MSDRDSMAADLADSAPPRAPAAPLVSDDVVQAFAGSMPLAYRATFNREAMAEHAAIVQRRGGRSAHVEIWKESADGTVCLCVVADDRPGLLSRISASLVAHGIDVVHANAYCRKRADGEMEAVDFISIRRLTNAGTEEGRVVPIEPHDVTRIGETLEALVLGRASFDGAVRFAVAVQKSSTSTRVRFDKDEGGGAMILTVEAMDRPGLLLVLTQTLFRAGVQIIGVRASTENGRAVDRFHLVELDGAPLRRERLLELQTAVLTAIEETWRREE